jgi:hypothetical protein
MALTAAAVVVVVAVVVFTPRSAAQRRASDWPMRAAFVLPDAKQTRCHRSTVVRKRQLP